MTYAIIEVAGKQYRVREGERLLVDRLPQEDGTQFAPTVLLLGGNGAPVLDPSGGAVTARVVAAVKGPKIRIGKYKKRTGYRRHTGFRASLTQIEIESIGAKPARARAKDQAARAASEAPVAEKAAGPKQEAAAAGVPTGYAEMTIADIKSASSAWSAQEIEAALAYEQEHGKRKGAVAALESALSKGGES